MRVLHLEDSAPDAELVAVRLTRDWPGCEVRHAASRAQFEAALEQSDFDLILSDYTLQDFDGLSALELARSRCPAKPFIFLSGTIGEERAIEALKRGASDYVIKDRPSRLIPAIRQALSRAEEESRLHLAEDSLREHRERFRQITENVADLIVMLDLAGRCVYGNPAHAAAVARDPGATGYEVFDDVHPEDRASVRQLFDETVRTGRSGRIECRLQRPDGTVRHVEAQASVVRDAAGAVTQVLIVARDVTERRTSDKRIHQQAALLDRAQDAILMRDMQDRITYWNQSAVRIYGWTATEARGRQTTALWNEDPAQVEVARHATLFYGEWMGEMRQRSRTGADLVMQSRWSLVRADDGSAAGFLVINTDIAEKKRLEAQFLRVQRTESIGMLAGGVAHDINNALVPILTATELLEGELTPEEQRQFVAAIRSSAQHGAALVRQLLAFARGAVGIQSELALDPLLRDFISFATQTFPPTVALTLAPGEEVWPIRADATQLKQVLMNLCLNARDAMPDGGRITIQAGNVTLSDAEAAALREAKAGPHVVLAVSDTGTGMPPELLEKIFDPFFTTKELGKGTGLGLAAVHGIVKGHNGAITVESTPGVGTTFRIYLPALHRSGPDTATPFASSRLRGAGQGILVVDDEPSICDILSALLTAHGYRVYKASSGSEGLAVFRAHPVEISAVLTDVMMADGDGFSVARELRRTHPRLPVIIMSGMAATRSYEDKARALGVPLLPKPIMRETLIRAVHDALANASAAVAS